MKGSERAFAVLAMLAVASCNFGDDVPGERVPRFEPLSSPPSVALVLGSGGPRGFAHVGVLKALEAGGIRPDLIIGSSVGAMVGSLYASGLSAAELERLALQLNITQFVELRSWAGMAASGRPVQEFVNTLLKGRPLEALHVPFAAAAMRVRDGTLVLFNHGDAGLAVRASSASKGQYDAVTIDGEAYVDGDEVSPVPIHAARGLGAKVVIAVDVSAFVEDTPPHVPREWVQKDARRARQVAAEAPEADVLLHPNIGYYAGHQEEYRRRVMAIAERFTRERLPAIRAALARAGIAPAAVHSASSARTPSGETSR